MLAHAARLARLTRLAYTGTAQVAPPDHAIPALHHVRQHNDCYRHTRRSWSRRDNVTDAGYRQGNGSRYDAVDTGFVNEQQQRKSPISALVLIRNANIACPADVNKLDSNSHIRVLQSVPSVLIDCFVPMCNLL